MLPGNVLFSVVDLNPIKIQGYLSESDINKVKIGTKAIVSNSNSITKTGKLHLYLLLQKLLQELLNLLLRQTMMIYYLKVELQLQ